MRSLSKIHFVIIILFFSFFLISCMKYRKENSDLNSIENLYITAKYYMNSGDYDSAIKVLYRIFEVEGEMPFLMNEFAMAFKGKGKFEKAIDYLDIAIAADSLNHIYFNNRGNIYITIGLLSKAEDDFIQSMKLNNS